MPGFFPVATGNYIIAQAQSLRRFRKPSRGPFYGTYCPIFEIAFAHLMVERLSWSITAIAYFGEMLVVSVLAIVLLAISPLEPRYAGALFAGGVVAWTLSEYVVHRFVLHNLTPTQHASMLGICLCTTVLTTIQTICLYHCSSITKSTIDLQLAIMASAQRCGITYSGRCCADLSKICSATSRR